MEKVEMNKQQVLDDLKTLKSSFHHIHKYYPLSDKETAKDSFNTIIEDLKEYLTKKLE